MVVFDGQQDLLCTESHSKLKGNDLDRGLTSVDLFEGTWRLNFTKSMFNLSPSFQNVIAKIEAQDSSLKINTGLMGFDGKLNRLQGAELLDSKDHPIPKDANLFGASSMKCKRVNGNVVVTVFKKGRKELGRSLDVVSEDGKTITRTQRGRNAQGHPLDIVAVYEKQ